MVVLTIDKVVDSNKLFTLFFEEHPQMDGISFETVEIRKFMFHGMAKPRKGDRLSVMRGENNQLVYHLNGVLVGSKNKPLSLPSEVLERQRIRRERMLAHVEEMKRQQEERERRKQLKKK